MLLYYISYFQFPRVQELFSQIDDDIYDEKKSQQESDADDMLVKVQQAIQQLQDRGELVTFQAVGSIVGISSVRFPYYPQAQALLKQHAQYQHHKTREAYLREEDVI